MPGELLVLIGAHCYAGTLADFGIQPLKSPSPQRKDHHCKK